MTRRFLPAACALALVAVSSSARAADPPADPPSATPQAPAASPPTAPAPTTNAAPGSWYEPKAGDPTFRDAPQRHDEHHVFVPALVLDLHTGLANKVRDAGSQGLFSETEGELRARFGGPLVGVTVGVIAPNWLYGAGLDFFRYAGVRVGNNLYVALPTVEARIYTRAFQQGRVGLGSALTGIRWTPGRYAIDLRFPRFDLWGGPFNDSFQISETWGVSASAAFVF